MENEELKKEIESLKESVESLKETVEFLSTNLELMETKISTLTHPKNNSREKLQIKTRVESLSKRTNMSQKEIYTKLYVRYGEANNIDLFDKNLREGRSIFNWLDFYGDMIQLRDILFELSDELCPPDDDECAYIED